jgi:hypothetical protein
MAATHIPNADLSYLKIYDLSVIQNIYKWIAGDSQIEFNYPQGVCQQRAQIMSMFLSKKFNIDHLKVWLFPPSALYIGDERQLYIEDKNGVTPDGKIEWNYHVAPIVQVRFKDVTNTMVIDPSIDRKVPILLDEWLKIIGNSGAGKYSFLLPDKYFFYCCYTSNNILTTIFDGTFFNYENPMKDDLAVEKGLAINDMAINIINKYIKPLFFSDNEKDKLKLKDLKEIFGNTTALDMLISQNISGYSNNTMHRYVITNYSKIIKEARNNFNERLIYWTNIINHLL